jgi:pimeloyl-ACP methyl ester carboxylesterase
MMNAEPRYVSVNDTRLAYFEWGTGAPVLFVHGSVSDHRFWTPQVRVLSEHYRCIALDQCHFGQSEAGAERTFDLTAHADDLCQFIPAVVDGPVHAVATSYGAGVVLASAVADPSRFKTLFLHEPFLPSVVTESADLSVLAQALGELAAVVGALAQGDQPRAVEFFVDWIASAGAFAILPQSVKAMALDNARTVALQLASDPPSVTASQVGALAMPIEITAGEKTKPFFLVQARAIHRCLPKSRLTYFSEAGHNASLEDAAQFNAALLAHLAHHAAA